MLWRGAVARLMALSGHTEALCELALEECDGDVGDAADVLLDLEDAQVLILAHTCYTYSPVVLVSEGVGLVQDFDPRVALWRRVRVVVP